MGYERYTRTEQAFWAEHSIGHWGSGLFFFVFFFSYWVRGDMEFYGHSWDVTHGLSFLLLNLCGTIATLLSEEEICDSEMDLSLIILAPLSLALFSLPPRLWLKLENWCSERVHFLGRKNGQNLPHYSDKPTSAEALHRQPALPCLHGHPTAISRGTNDILLSPATTPLQCRSNQGLGFFVTFTKDS